MTKEQLIASLADLEDGAVVVCPGIWVKADVEDVYAYGDPMREIELTEDQWSRVVEIAEASEHVSDEELVYIVEEVLKS